MASNTFRVSTANKAMKWYGVPELKRLFSEFALELGPDGMGKARDDLKNILLKPAYVMRDEAKDMAPVRTGKLRAAIYATKGPDDKRGVIVGVATKAAPYAKFVERGTSKMPANPFFRPAIRATAPTVASMISGDMKKLIEEMAGKLAYHAPTG